jgi:hypothetical protein
MVEEAFSGDDDTRRAHRSEALRHLTAALAEIDRWDPSSVLGARCQHLIDDLELLIKAEP